MKATDDELATAIKKHGGVLTEVAKACGMTYRGVAKRIAASDELKALVDEERERLIDMAEMGLRKSVAKGSPWAVKFILATLGRSRGYTKTVRVEGETRAKIVLRFPDNNRRLAPLKESPMIEFEKPSVDSTRIEPSIATPANRQASNDTKPEPAQSTTRATPETSES